MPIKYKPVKVSSKSKKRAKKNWLQPITEVPTLRYYQIDGKTRLVWVWKENGRYKIRVNESQARFKPKPDTVYRKMRSEIDLKEGEEFTYKKLPKNLRNALAQISKDDVEWGGAIDFEGDFSLPERFIIKSGGEGYISLRELEDFELTFHTHPIENEIGFMPSNADISSVEFGKPHIMVWTNEKTGKTKFVHIESLHRDEEKSQIERLKEIDKIDKEILRIYGSNTHPKYYQAFKDELAMAGYKIQDIDPVRHGISMFKDDRMERTVTIRGTRDLTRKHVQEMIKDTYVYSDDNIAYTLSQIKVKAEKADRDNSIKGKLLDIIDDPTENPRKKLSQVKNLVEPKKVTELRKDIAKSQMPYTDHLKVNNSNYQRYQRDLKAWKKTPQFKEIKKTRSKAKLKKMSTGPSKKPKKATDKPMNVGLQQHVISRHIQAETKDDPFFKDKPDAQDIEDLQAFIDPELSLEENIIEIDNMMRYGYLQAPKKKTMFGPPKHKKYAEMVSLKSAQEAEKSIKKLEKEFKEAKTDQKRNRIIKVANLASNRAKALTKNPNLKPETKKRLKKVSSLYREATDDFSSQAPKEKVIRGKTKAQVQAELNEMLSLMQKGRKNLTPQETKRLDQLTSESLKTIGEEKYMRLEAPTKKTSKTQATTIKIDKDIDKAIEVEGNDWEIEKVSVAKSGESLSVSMRAKKEKAKAQPLAKPLSKKDEANVKRMLGWKRIKEDPKLRGTLENIVE